MKIVTVVRQVPDAEARVRIEEGAVALSGAAWVLDGMDEYGVEEALRLRDGGSEVEILALALGPERSEEALRTALSLGADRALLLVAAEEPDPLPAAKRLAEAIRAEGADLVFVGGKQADWDSAALGPALAEALGWPLADWTTSLQLEDRVLQVVHDADGGAEQMSLPLPAVVSTQQGLNEPRYPTLPNIMKARRKELRFEPAGQLPAPVRTVGRTLEQHDRQGRIVSGSTTEAVQQLAEVFEGVSQ